MKEIINIGSTGFSQMGTQDYYEKARFEGAWLIDFYTKRFILPSKLHLSWMRNAYEHDCYWDLNVYFRISEVLPESEEETQLWQFINDLEEFDIESLEEQIQFAWDEKIRLQKIAAVLIGDGSHLSKAV